MVVKMNIFKKIFKIGMFVPKTIFEASQDGADFLNKALEKADGNKNVDEAEKVLVELVCLALKSQGVSVTDEIKSKAKDITVESLNKANPKARKVLKWYSNIDE